MPNPVEQISLAELREADRRGDADVINAWRKAGRLQAVLEGRDPGSEAGPASSVETEAAEATSSADQGARTVQVKGQLTEADLKVLGPFEIDRARREGRCDQLLGRR